MTQASRFAGRRGISMVLVVILVIFTIILTTAAMMLYFRWNDLAAHQESLKKQREYEKTEVGLIPLKIVKNVLGTGMSTVDATAVKELPVGRPKTEYETRLKEVMGDDAAKAREARLFPTLQSLVELYASRTEAQYNRMQNLKLELDIAKKRADNRAAAKQGFSKKKEDFIADMTERIARINQLIADENNTYNQRKTELTTVKDDSTRIAEEETTAFYNWEIRIKNETRELQRQLEELKVKEVIKVDISKSHGRILRPDVPNKVAFIDIGSRDRVVGGLKFLVARRGDQGRFEFKAEIIVKKVWMTYSEVAITQVYKTDYPVIEGDLIVNPLFDKHRPIVVAFAGEERPLRVRPAWSIDEASRRIREIGSTVRKEPDLDVDFVIWTEAGSSGGSPKPPNQYKEYAKAQLLEIPIADAADMFKFLGE